MSLMKVRLLALASVVLCLLVVTACRRNGDSPAARAPAGQSTWSLDVGGRPRTYRLFVPPDLPTGPVPLVLMLHGGFGDGAQAERAYGWDDVARADGLVVAYPDGLDRAWNAGGGCCGEPAREGVDDVAFLSAAVGDIERRATIDPARVFATGMSNGAIMSYRLACSTTLFAAIAPVAGTLLGDCPSPAPTSVLHIHGLADRNVRYDGSPGAGIASIDGPPVPDVVGMWRTVDGCPPPPAGTVNGDVTVSTVDCPGGRAVELITIGGAGHQWPGSDASIFQGVLGLDPPSTAIDATQTIAAFFTAHPRP
jgi:polyhydroxybutyrate depolymerase